MQKGIDSIKYIFAQILSSAFALIAKWCTNFHPMAVHADRDSNSIEIKAVCNVME